MSLRLTQETDEWTAEIHWGRDVTGSPKDVPDTLIFVIPSGPLTQDGAIELGEWLLKKVRGDDE